MATEGAGSDSEGLGTYGQCHSPRGEWTGEGIWSFLEGFLEGSSGAFPCSLQEEAGEAEAMGPALHRCHCPSVYAHVIEFSRVLQRTPPLPRCSDEGPEAQRRRHGSGLPREQGSESPHLALTPGPLHHTTQPPGAGTFWKAPGALNPFPEPLLKDPSQ